MRARPKTIRELLIAGIAVCAIASPIVNFSVIPAAAQAVSVSVEFRTALEPYGAWQHHRRWGDVWIPSRVAHDWRPYTVGHWVYSQDYGWYWAPDEQEADWGLVTYHYGRWVMDDQFGWIWIPGTEWGPGWVQWRHGKQHVGWAPLPPDDVIVEYREAPQYWVFVRERDLVAPRITEVILPPQEREVFFRDTVVVNRTVELQDRRFGVNPGIPPTYIAAAYGRPIPTYESRRVCSPAPQICLARSWCGRTISVTASVFARSPANRRSFGRRRTRSRRRGSCRCCSRLARMSAAGLAPCRLVPRNPVPRSQDKTDRKVRMRRRRLARNLPPAGRRMLHPDRAQLLGNPRSSRGAKAAPACRNLPQALRYPTQVRCAAIKTSATNAICARVGRQRTRPVRRPQRALRPVRSAMRAEEMCAERSPGVTSAA